MSCGRRAWDASAPVWGSGCEEGCGDDGDAVAASVGVCAGGDDGGVEGFGADVVGEPTEVAGVAVVDGAGEFRFRGVDFAVAAFDDEVVFVFAAVGA